MNIDLVKEIVEYLAKIAEPLATKGYELVLKQVQYLMIANTVGFIIGLAVIVSAIVLTINLFKDDEVEFGMISILFGLVGMIPFFTCGLYALNALINPEWMAIQLILKSIQ